MMLVLSVVNDSKNKTDINTYIFIYNMYNEYPTSHNDIKKAQVRFREKVKY